LTEKQLQQALKAQEENGKTKPLGEILIRLGFIDASKLQEIIRLQIIESVNSMLDWRDAVFRFEDQEVSSGNDIQLSVQDIMTEAANYARGPSQEQAAVESETSAESFPLRAPDTQAEGKTEKLQEEINSMINRVTDRLRSMEPKQAVVLVEDETLLRTIFKDKLEDFGFNVYAVDSAQSAIVELERLDTEGFFSVVVTDLVLPTISGKGVLGGLELVEHLRNNYPHIPLIPMSISGENHSSWAFLIIFTSRIPAKSPSGSWKPR
jgi:CheY-like chemotaxis protein